MQGAVRLMMRLATDHAYKNLSLRIPQMSADSENCRLFLVFAFPVCTVVVYRIPAESFCFFIEQHYSTTFTQSFINFHLLID
jgi:hypothetical protein